MQTIESKSASQNIHVSLGTRFLDILGNLYENTLGYPIVKDEHANISELKKVVKENRKSYRIFSPNYNQKH